MLPVSNWGVKTARRGHAPKRRSLGGNIAEGNPKGAQACALAPPSGGGSVANEGVLPVPMLPISNWGLKLAHAVHKMRCPKGQEIWYNLRRGEKRFRTVP